MRDLSRKHTPQVRMLGLFVLAVAASLLAATFAARMPTFHRALEAGTILASDQGEVTLEEQDLLAEPGEIAVDADLDRFYQRQDTAAAIVAGNALRAVKAEEITPLTPENRGMAGLPALFWIQLAVGVGALLISGFVWALKPKDLASRCFLLSGLATLTFTLSAAIYTTRDSALAASSFQTLTVLNAVGASLFGISTLALFLIYPLRVRGWKKLVLAEAGLFGVWTLLSVLRVAPAWAGVNFITLVEMLGICAAIGAQFVATRKDLRARAALKWLGLAVLVGAGSFIALNALPLVLNEAVAVEQGYAFLFFLFIYVGIAAGLSRYRLFDVGQWSYRFFFYSTGAFLLVLLDAGLVFGLGLDRLPAFGLAILAISFLYLPLRDAIWRRLSRRAVWEPQKLLSDSLYVAFAASATERSSRWEALVRKVFDPLEIVPSEQSVSEVTTLDDGLSLLLPPVANVSSLKVTYPFSGRGLFNSQSQELARQLIKLVQQAESSREAYDRGVVEERKRMAQDLHDDIGARLLTGLYMADDNLKPIFQEALADIREIVNETVEAEVPLANLIADVRYETDKRLTSAKIHLDWPIAEWDETDVAVLDARQHKALRSALREVVSNVIRHSHASGLKVRVASRDDAIDLMLKDDGQGFDLKDEEGRSGNGLKNIRRRLESIGGSCRFESEDTGSSIHLTVPFRKAPRDQGMNSRMH